MLQQYMHFQSIKLVPCTWQVLDVPRHMDFRMQCLQIRSSFFVVASIPISCSQSMMPPKNGFEHFAHMKKLAFASAKAINLL